MARCEIIIHWESGWLSSQVEHFMWKQLAAAFDVKRLIYVGRPDNSRTNVEWYETVKEAIDSSNGRLVILNPFANSCELPYEDDIVLLLGNAMISNENIKGDHVRIDTPKSVDIFAINAASIILDRYNNVNR